MLISHILGTSVNLAAYYANSLETTSIFNTMVLDSTISTGLGPTGWSIAAITLPTSNYTLANSVCLLSSQQVGGRYLDYDFYYKLEWEYSNKDMSHMVTQSSMI
jgi:hypothetical protein